MEICLLGLGFLGPEAASTGYERPPIKCTRLQSMPRCCRLAEVCYMLICCPQAACSVCANRVTRAFRCQRQFEDLLSKLAVPKARLWKPSRCASRRIALQILEGGKLASQSKACSIAALGDNLQSSFSWTLDVGCIAARQRVGNMAGKRPYEESNGQVFDQHHAVSVSLGCLVCSYARSTDAVVSIIARPVA